MVQNANSNQATQAQDSHDLTVDGCVCPQCYKHLRAPVVTEGGGDRYGRRMRSYAGMCFECLQGCRVTQFEQDGKWLINSYLPHRYEAGKFIGISDWIEVNPLPEPPAVVTGPGGDFDKAPDLSGNLALPLLRSAADMMLKVAHTIRELLATTEKLQRNELDNRKH